VYRKKHIEFDDIVIYLSIYSLLYADDTIILAESVTDLQCALNTLYTFCSNWDLEVNAGKTKVLIFSKGKIRNIPTFTYGENNVEVVFEYNYLGIIFNYNGSFVKARKKLADQATKAMFAIITNARKQNLPIDIQLQLFDALVMPILLYGCEVLGVDDNYVNKKKKNIDLKENYILEKVHLKFCKMILHINKSTPSSIVYGELGRFPLNVYISCRIINFWSRLATSDLRRISSIMYKLLYSLDQKNVFQSNWVVKVKDTLNSCGFSYIWNSQESNCKNPHNFILQNLKDQFNQSWLSDIWHSNTCINYRIFKTTLDFEEYLINLPRKDAIALCKFRTGSNKIPIVSGRFNNIDRADRICNLCHSDIGDEFHYIFICPTHSTLRKKYIPSYYLKGTNTLKMNKLFNAGKQTLRNLAIFCKIIMQTFSNTV